MAIAATGPTTRSCVAPSARRSRPKMRGMLFYLRMIFSENRLPIPDRGRGHAFRDHARSAGAVVRVGGAQPAAQLGAQLLGHAHRIDAVADDLRADEDDKLGALCALVVAAEQLAEFAELVDQRQAGAA